MLHSIKTHLEGHKAYRLAREIRWIVEDHFKNRVVSLKSQQPSKGNVLFSYNAAFDGFSLTKIGQRVPISHTNYWMSMQMAKTFLELGYDVDVISNNDRKFLPEKNYSIFVDQLRNLERIAPLLNKDCVKIMHIATSNTLFHSTAELSRLLALQQRRGVTLKARRYLIPDSGIEHADCATTTGNEFTISTYSYASKPIHRLPIPATVRCPWPETKDWEVCRRRFLWFSSEGLVHKGLDLALEAFVDMPECHLTVCCPIDGEEDFVRIYHKELYQTPNIETIGWVDVNSPKFIEVTNSCIGQIRTSCSEAGCGSAVNCLHAGLIPIVNRESSVDVHDFGFLLKSCSIDDIKESIRMVADLSAQEIKERARKTWEHARANYTREKFAETYRNVVIKIIAEHGSNGGDRYAQAAASES